MRFKKNIKKICFSIGILILFFVFNNVFAEGGLVPCGGAGQDPCTINHLFTLFYNVIGFFMTILIPLVAVVLIIYGAINFILAAEDQARIKKGKDIIKGTVIGLIIVYGAKFIIESLISILTGL